MLHQTQKGPASALNRYGASSSGVVESGTSRLTLQGQPRMGARGLSRASDYEDKRKRSYCV